MLKHNTGSIEKLIVKENMAVECFNYRKPR